MHKILILAIRNVIIDYSHSSSRSCTSPTRPIESDEYYVHSSTFSWSSSSFYDQEVGAMVPAGGDAASSPIFFWLVLHRAEKIYPAAPEN